MINILKNITRINSLKEQKLPKHIAISTRSISSFKKQDKDVVSMAVDKIFEFMLIQQKLNIPILTINLKNETDLDTKFIEKLMLQLSNNESIINNKVKIMVIGKWFDLPIAITEQIKKVMDETKEYDQYFLNFLINYNGKDEISAAIKLLTLKSVNKQIDPEKIDNEIIKDALYTSYFMPPNIIIECGYTFSGTLLWDAIDANIYFSENKHWLSMDKKDIDEALTLHKKSLIKKEPTDTKEETEQTKEEVQN
jgi:undecaprenyl diphosphate synthase